MSSTPPKKESEDPTMTQIPTLSNGEVENHGTQRGLSSCHGQMIAFGGAVGTGLLVSTGAVLAMGGPLMILICYIILVLTMYIVITSLTEIATFVQVQGVSVSYYGEQIVSKSLGFSLGWLYVYSLGILVPYEITAGALIIEYWNSPVPVAVWITIFIVVIVALNFLPVRYYGESEFWFSFIKLITMAGLLVLSFVLFWGGGPKDDGILGFRYWKDPGPTQSWILDGPIGTFVAFVGVFVYSGFPFTFTPELVIYASGEMSNPMKNLPIAANRYILRLGMFYVGTVICIGIICPADIPDLTNGDAGAKSSPFVLGIQQVGIRGLGSVINAVILMSAWSAGNAFLYISLRGLYSLALSGQAPKIFTRCNSSGTPYAAVLGAALFTPLAYLNVGSNSSTVFNWFISMVNTTGFISWVSCAIIYLRFRKAWKVQGEPRLPYKTRFTQPWGSWLNGIFFTILTLINGFNVFLPGQFTISGFLTTYIGLPLFLMFYIGHKIIKGRGDPWAYPPESVVIQPEGSIEQPQDEESVRSEKGWSKYMGNLKL